MVVVIGVAAFVVALVMTPVVGAFAVKYHFVAIPSARGVHDRPTPVLGGIAVMLGIAVGLVLGAVLLQAGIALIATIVIAVVMTGVGAVDDRVSLQWHTKLFVQLAAAFVYVLIECPLPGFGPLGTAVATLWLVVIMNGINFTDVCNGLASGMATIAAATLAVLAALDGQVEASMLGIAVCGAASAFFLHNFPSGAIFLGDAGSLAIGFVLGALALHVVDNGEPFAMIAPALALAYPLFDLGFVVVSRWHRGIPIVHGGTDHTVHRLSRRVGGSRLAVTLLLIAASLVATGVIVAEVR